MFNYFFLFLIVLIVWYWFDTSAKREIAIQQGRQLAQKLNLQLLDESVHCHKLKLIRSEANWPSIKRIYYFSVSANKKDRLHCQLTLTGKKLTNWYVPPYPEYQ